MKKRLILITLLVAMILISFSSILAFTDNETDNYKYIPKVVTVDGNDKMIFDAELARISRKMSTDTYKLRYDSNAKEIAKTFVAEGFTDIQQSHYFDNYFMGSFSNNFLVGAKSFNINGKNKHIVAIAFRGTTIDGFDYGDLFTDASVIDTNGFHTGFYAAAHQAFNTLNDMQFPSLRNDDGTSMTFADFLANSGVVGGDYYILVTGHSLGGAVANIFTGEILGQINKSNIMCYTFAAPKVCTSNTATQHNAYNIFNVINNNDIVPDVGYNIFVGTRMGNDFRVTVSDSEESAHDLTVTYDKALDKVIDNIDSLYPYIHRVCYNEVENGITTQKDEIHIHSDSVIEKRKALNFMPYSDIVMYKNLTLEQADLSVNNLKLLNNTTLNGQSNSISVNDLILNSSTINSTLNVAGDITSSSGTITSLNLCGNSAQNIEGALNTTNLTYSNVGSVNQIGTIYVSGALKNTSSKVINGKNTVLKSTGYINGDYYNSSLTLDGATLSSYKKFGESLYTQGTVNLSDIDITAIFCQNSGTLNLNGNVTVGDDVSFSGTVTQANDKTFNLKGDLTASSANLGNINVCGKLGQTINSPITVNDFSNNNTSKNGLTLDGTVTVNGQASSVKAPVNGKNIVLTNTASFKGNTYYGDITVNGLTGSLPATLNGKLRLNGNVEQSANSTVTGDIEISSGTLNIKNANLTANKKLTFSGGAINLENSNLTVKSILNTASETSLNIDENSLLYLKTDSVNNGTISGTGNLEIYGDFQNSGTVNVKNLKITAKLPVTISGNNITANVFSTSGTSTITLDNKINVLDTYTNSGAKVNSGNIVFSSGNNIGSDVQYGENMNVTGDLVIDGFTVTVVQNAEVTGNIVITNGGKLNVGKNLILKNGNITLSDNSLMTVGGKTDITVSNSNALLIDSTSEVVLKKLAIISGMGNITTDGKLSFGSDTSLSSVNLNGSGTVSLKGDLILSSSTVDYPDTFILNGKAPQILSGGTMNFNNITINNPSRSGVTFSNTARYKGEYINNNSTVSGTLNKQ